MRPIVQTDSKQEGILHRPTATVQTENRRLIQRLTLKLFNELRGRNSIALGIALNQLGSPYNGFIAKIGGTPRVFFNASLVKTRGYSFSLPEACLSVKKGKRDYNVKRYLDITINYYDYKLGRIRTESFEGDDAIVIQHEIDHCEGITILDRSTDEDV